MCRNCVETLTSLLKAYQEFLKLRQDLSETTKLFNRIDQKDKKPNTRTVWTNTKCPEPEPLTQPQPQPIPILLLVAPSINSGNQSYQNQIPRTTILPKPINNQNVPETITTTNEISRSSEGKDKNQDQRRITRSHPTVARKGPRIPPNIKRKWPQLKELSINLERCDNLVGPDGKVSFIDIDIKEEESEDEAKPEVIFDGDFLMVPPTPEEETNTNDDPLWVPGNEDFEDAAEMDVDKNDENNDKSIESFRKNARVKAGKVAAAVKNKPQRKQFVSLQCRCSERLPTTRTFLDHVVQFHPEQVKPRKAHSRSGNKGKYKCDLCNIKYVEIKTLRRHIRKWHCFGSEYISEQCPADPQSYDDIFKSQQELVQALVPILPPMKGYRDKDINQIEGRKKWERKPRAFPCTFENCRKSYDTDLSLQLHIRLKHRRPATFQCLSCPETFPTSKASLFMSHVVESHPELVKPREPTPKHAERSKNYKIQCSICSIKFTNSPSLIGHLRRVHCKHKPHKCTWEGCGKSFFKRICLDEHVKNYHERKGQKFVCELCGAVFLYEPNLQRHLKNTRTHETTILFKCEQCFSEFTTKVALQWHAESKHGAEKIVNESRPPPPQYSSLRVAAEKLESISQSCPICSKEFSCLRDLEVHVRKDHSNDPPPAIYLCRHSGCQKKYKAWKDLTRHKNSHQEPALACPFPNCEKIFKTSRELNKHNKSHLEPTLACNFPSCDRKFRYRCNLKTHLETHKEQRERKEATFLCDICPKKFTSKRLLQQHIKCVHEKRSLKKSCPFPGCGKILDACNFRRHLEIHEANRNPKFPCDVCGKLFVNSSGLYQHKRFIHEKHPWPRKKKTEKTTTTILSSEDGNESQGPQPSLVDRALTLIQSKLTD